MGRDDARPIRGLHGGTAPARAFAAFMRPATAKRPIEQFDTQVTLPEWQIEPDEESYFGQPDNSGQMVDENGNPIAGASTAQPVDPSAPDERPDDDTSRQQLDDLIDRVTGRDGPPRDAPRDPAAGEVVPPGRQPLPAPIRQPLPPVRQPVPVQDDRPTQ
jgi:penicillin-binding protein 1A